MVGNEKLPTFVLSKTNKLYNIMDYKIYQLVSKKDNELPKELYSWQVFLTKKKDALRWLMLYNYNLEDYNIVEYNKDDIEDWSVVDLFI